MASCRLHSRSDRSWPRWSFRNCTTCAARDRFSCGQWSFSAWQPSCLGFRTCIILALLALVLMGAADAVSTIIRNTIRQLQTPDHIRGRMTSINQIFFQGGPQLGEVEAGVVAQLFGVPFAIISGGIGCIVGMFLIILKWPQLRFYNGEEPIPAESFLAELTFSPTPAQQFIIQFRKPANKVIDFHLDSHYTGNRVSAYASF